MSYRELEFGDIIENVFKTNIWENAPPLNNNLSGVFYTLIFLGGSNWPNNLKINIFSIMMSEREEEALKKMPMKQFFIWMKKNRIFDELKKNTRVLLGGGVKLTQQPDFCTVFSSNHPKITSLCPPSSSPSLTSPHHPFIHELLLSQFREFEKCKKKRQTLISDNR